MDRAEPTMTTQASTQKTPSLNHLFGDAYENLRNLAARIFRRERIGHTLQPTAVVHEAYLRLARQGGSSFCSRSEFVAVATLMIRRALVDYARRYRASHRPPPAQRVSLADAGEACLWHPNLDLVALDETLNRLEKLDPRKARIVQMRFFGGLTVNEVGDVLSLSPRMVAQEWALARAWLHREMSDD